MRINPCSWRHWYIHHTVFAWMDAGGYYFQVWKDAVSIWRRLLFKSSYHSRYAYLCIIVRTWRTKWTKRSILTALCGLHFWVDSHSLTPCLCTYAVATVPLAILNVIMVFIHGCPTKWGEVFIWANMVVILCLVQWLNTKYMPELVVYNYWTASISSLGALATRLIFKPENTYSFVYMQVWSNWGFEVCWNWERVKLKIGLH